MGIKADRVWWFPGPGMTGAATHGGPEVEVGFRPSGIREDKTEHCFVYVGVLLPRSSLAGLSEVGSLWVTGCPLPAAGRLGGRKPNSGAGCCHRIPGHQGAVMWTLLHCSVYTVRADLYSGRADRFFVGLQVQKASCQGDAGFLVSHSAKHCTYTIYLFPFSEEPYEYRC